MGQVTWTPERRAAQAERMRAQMFKGDEVGYDAVHWRLRPSFRLKPCAHCGALGRSEVALIEGRGDKVDNYYETPRPYSTSPEDYIPLCTPCHRKYDGLFGRLN